MKTTPEQLTKDITKSAKIDVDLGLGADDVSIELPRELAILNPVFRLRTDGAEAAAPAKNHLGDKAIEVQFGSVANLDDAKTKGEATLVISSRFGDFEVGLDLQKRSLTSVNYLPASR